MLRNIFKVCAGTTGLLPRESIPLETISVTDGPLSRDSVSEGCSYEETLGRSYSTGFGHIFSLFFP